MLVDSSLWNASQNWSSSVTSDTSVVNPANGFDGSTSTTINGSGNGSRLTFTPSTPIAYTTSVKVYSSSNGSLSLNGGTAVNTGSVGQYYTLATGSGTITSIVMQGGGDSASWAAIEVDGSLLVNAGGGTFNTLFQTWAEYVRSTLGYALDRIAQLEALRAGDAVQISELRTQITGALNRLASLESDEVNDDAVDNALLTLVGNMSSQITAWSTRIQVLEDYMNQ